MQHFKNAKMRRVQDGAKIGMYFTDDEGRDWYEVYRSFWRTTVRIVYSPSTGFIHMVTYGTQPVLFEGVSVVELDRKALPDDFTDDTYRCFDGVLIKQE